MPKRFLPALLLLIAPAAAPTGALAASTPFKTFLPLAATQQAAHPYTASEIQTAYDVTPLINAGFDGSGRTIALLEWGGFSQSDIAAFDQANNLPDPTINVTYVGGKQFPLDRSSSSRGETTLDLEWAHAMAPGATINVYYLNNNVSQSAGWREIAQAVTQAATDGAGTLSVSFGICSPGSGAKVVQTALAAARQKGMSAFAASGDSGAFAGPKKQCGSAPAVAYPASDPSVVSVGGTTLHLNGDSTIASETAWSLSGGGKARPFPRPVWQVAPQLRPGPYRQVPDVAFDGNQNTGVEVIFNGRRIAAGGTSLGAPAWAGIWSLIQQDASQSGKTVGAAPQLIYRVANSSAYSSAFHDITTGGNSVYHAHVGWDRVTGWGTPDVNNLATAILAIS
jgi:kumamolisin